MLPCALGRVGCLSWMLLVPLGWIVPSPLGNGLVLALICLAAACLAELGMGLCWITALTCPVQALASAAVLCCLLQTWAACLLDKPKSQSCIILVSSHEGLLFWLQGWKVPKCLPFLSMVMWWIPAGVDTCASALRTSRGPLKEIHVSPL